MSYDYQRWYRMTSFSALEIITPIILIAARFLHFFAYEGKIRSVEIEGEMKRKKADGRVFVICHHELC